MTTGPGDPIASGATGRGRLRASDADREHMIDTLKTAFVQGRLTKDELEMRAGQAFTSRTYAELAAITADIPAGLIGAQLPPKTARVHARKPVNKRVVVCGACLIILLPVLGAAFLATYYGGFILMFVLAFIGFAVTAEPGPSS